MKNIQGFKCLECGKEFPFKKGTYQCNSCGGNLEVIYDYKIIGGNFSRESLKNSQDFSIWRYFPLYPLSDKRLVPPLNIGWTPLYKAQKLGKDLDLSNLYLKDDGRNPSASFKDRASAIALVRAMEEGAKIVTGASTGNAGSSMACLSASVGMPAVIFVPQKAPKAKIAQLLTFGAKIIMVKGTYDEAFDLCLKVSAEYGWFNRNTGYNPYTREGKKSCALEIAEQLNWKAPDRVFVSVGDGNIISGIWKGFMDLYELKFIDRLPKMMGVQSTLSNAISLSLKESKGKDKIAVKTVSATTIADSISVDLPRDGVAAVRAIRESGGDAVEVTDEEILDSITTVARGAGIFGEPAGVTSFAGARKLAKSGKLSPKETVVCIITGNGLKDIESAMKVAGEPVLIEPTLEEVKKIFPAG